MLKPSQISGLTAIIRRAYELAADRDRACGTEETERLLAFGVVSENPTAAMLDHVISISYHWADTDDEEEQSFHDEAKALKRWIEEDAA